MKSNSTRDAAPTMTVISFGAVWVSEPDPGSIAASAYAPGGRSNVNEPSPAVSIDRAWLASTPVSTAVTLACTGRGVGLIPDREVTKPTTCPVVAPTVDAATVGVGPVVAGEHDTMTGMARMPTSTMRQRARCASLLLSPPAVDDVVIPHSI